MEAERLSPEGDLARTGVAWFVARDGALPVGVVRVLFDLSLDLCRTYDLKSLSTDLDIERLLREYRIAEVGRFAVLPECRGEFLIAAHLIRAAGRETLARRYTPRDRCVRGRPQKPLQVPLPCSRFRASGDPRARRT